MSERTLARLVRQEVGMSFGRWRQRLHIILALQWLSEGLSVQRSADQLGYESVSAFITMPQGAGHHARPLLRPGDDEQARERQQHGAVRQGRIGAFDARLVLGQEGLLPAGSSGPR